MSKKRVFDVIIIGGGVSGLACANRLFEKNKDFLLITKHIGGRMITNIGKVNFGACYLRDDYKNILKYSKKGKELKISDAYFLDKEDLYGIKNLRLLKNIPQMTKLLLILNKFKKHLKKFQENLENKSVKQALDEDPYLLELFKTPAKKFIKNNNLEDINEKYLEPVVKCTIYMDLKEINALFYLEPLLPLVVKSYFSDFNYTLKNLIKNIKSKIKIGNIKKIRKKDNLFQIDLLKQSFLGKNIVIAVPEKNLEKAYKVVKPKIQRPVYVFHIKGVRKKQFKNKIGIFKKSKNSDFCLLLKEFGQDILYTRNPRPDLKEFYKTIKKKIRFFWPIYLSAFLGLGLYIIFKFIIKRRNFILTSSIFIILLVSFSGIIKFPIIKQTDVQVIPSIPY